jgi:hypothetical protein
MNGEMETIDNWHHHKKKETREYMEGCCGVYTSICNHEVQKCNPERFKVDGEDDCRLI